MEEGLVSFILQLAESLSTDNGQQTQYNNFLTQTNNDTVKLNKPNYKGLEKIKFS